MGPGADPFNDADLRRLFADPVLTPSRRTRLRAWPCVVASFAGQIVGVAACENAVSEMRVMEFAIEVPHTRESARTSVTRDTVANAVVDAIELMALAGGCSRVVLNAPPLTIDTLRNRGYAGSTTTGGWLAKSLG